MRTGPARKSVAWDKETITGFDLVLIATNHACVNYQQLADWTACIVDTRNAMAGIGNTAGASMESMRVAVRFQGPRSV